MTLLQKLTKGRVFQKEEGGFLCPAPFVRMHILKGAGFKKALISLTPPQRTFKTNLQKYLEKLRYSLKGKPLLI